MTGYDGIDSALSIINKIELTSKPLNEAKGELLIIHAPELDIQFLLKSSLFVLPLGNHYFKVGATFNWKDKTSEE